MKPTFLIIMLTSLLLLGACKRKKYEASGADSTLTKTDTSANTTKLVKTAGISFKVKNVQQTAEDVSTLTAKFNGMVMHHQMTSTAEQTRDVHLSNDSVMHISSFNTNADMTVKIPTEKVDEFLTTVSHMSVYVNERRMDIEDKSLDYLSSQLKLSNRRTLVAQQKNGKVIIKDPGAVLNLKDDMVDEQINNQKINEDIKYSIVSLSFYQSNTISKEIVANDDPSNYNLPFFTQLGMAIANGWYLFSELIIGMVNLWAIILCGVIVWLGIRFYNKRKIELKS